MQLSWLWRGLRTGVLTTRYPHAPASLPAGFRGRPVLDATRCRAADDGCARCVQACLPGAIARETDAAGRVVALRLDYGSCIMCGLCVSACPTGAMMMTTDVELATRDPDNLIHIVHLQRGATDGHITEPSSGS